MIYLEDRNIYVVLKDRNIFNIGIFLSWAPVIVTSGHPKNKAIVIFVRGLLHFLCGEGQETM